MAVLIIVFFVAFIALSDISWSSQTKDPQCKNIFLDISKPKHDRKAIADWLISIGSTVSTFLDKNVNIIISDQESEKTATRNTKVF